MTPADLSLFYPMLVLFLWTFLVMLRNLHVRIRALRTRQVRNKYFELFLGDQAPDVVLKTGNHFNNLMQFPPLFYVVAILIMMTQQTDTAFIALAWAYVALRIAHSLEHLTRNRVTPRFSLFFASTLIVLALWLRLAWRLYSGAV